MNSFLFLTNNFADSFMFCKFSLPAKFPDIVCCAICFKAFGGTSPIPTKDIALVNVENF